MNFISICSGIEAASVAFGPLGWKAIAFSEIEPFPCAVLAHHYPHVPNFGDMTKFREWPEEIFANADVIVGGPPCQAFSVAGLRNGLNDDRGNITLIYAELINHADAIRIRHGKPPVVVLYENVPGLLSDKTGAFGCFLGALAGEDGEVVPPGGKWTNAGCVSGPERTLAWAVTDAQFFGVAQRRRRVFVVASAREGFDPAAVLFEPESLRRDTAPSREAGEGAAGGVGVGAEGGSDVDHARAGHVLPITMAHGQGGAEIGFDRGPTLTCNHEAPIAAYAIQAGALRTNPNSGPDGVGVQADHAYTLEARAEVQAVCFAENSLAEIRLEGGDGQRTGALSTGGGNPGQGTPMVAYGIPGNWIGRKPENGGNAVEPMHDVSPCQTKTDRHGVAYTVSLRGREGGATADLGDDVGNCLRASSGGGDKAHVLAPVAIGLDQELNGREELAGTLQRKGQGGFEGSVMTPAMQVRRLTPVECERLQGFPDGYSAIPWRKKPASECPDGPRYRALGNSWAVPNVRWIGERIQRECTRLNLDQT